MSSPTVPAVFLGRDGILIEDRGYPHLEAHLNFVPGAVEAVRRLNGLGYLVVVVTNQSGVAQGMFSEGQMEAFNTLMVRRMAAKGARIAAVYACPYSDDARDERYFALDHPDRKPNPGMVLKAMEKFQVDPQRSFLIGARRSDLETARRAGVPGFLFDGINLDAYLRELLGG